MELRNKYDIIVAGAGAAGLNAALFLPRDKRVLLVCKEGSRQADSYLAQGGICVLRWDGDHDAYFEDTMRAGHYENDPETVECMLRCSREIISDLLYAGVRFSRDGAGNLLYTREGGHSVNRILYREDRTGREIASRLYARGAEAPERGLSLRNGAGGHSDGRGAMRGRGAPGRADRGRRRRCLPIT